MAPRHFALMMLINLIWGLNFLAIKYTVADIDPMFASALRFAIVGVALLPFLKIAHGHMPQLIKTAIVLGVFHFGFMMLAMNVADDVAPIAIAAQLGVPFATLLAVVMLKESVGWKRVAGIGFSFVGVMIMGFDPVVFDYIDGVMLMAASAFFYGLSTIMLRQLKDVPAMTTQAWVAVAGVSGSLCLSFLIEDNQFVELQNIGEMALYGLLFSGLLSSFVGHGGINYLLTKYEVAVVTPYTLLTPLVAVIASVVILGEELTPRMIIGGGLTLLGVTVVTLRNIARAKTTVAEAHNEV